MSGHVGDLSPQQEEALKRFKAAVADIQNKPEDNDYYYLRWLRARRFDVRKAEQMLRNHMKDRVKYEADTIMQTYTPPEVLQKCVPGGYFGEDRDGHPVWYDNVGTLDFKGIYRSTKKEDLVKFKWRSMEECVVKLKEASEKHGRVIETVTLVVDFEGLSFKKHYHWPSIEAIKNMLKIAEDNFPERTHTILIVKAPSIFPLAYNIVKPVLDERTRQKVQILGSNWQEEIQKYISPDELPQAYGGNRCEPDPLCTNYINPGMEFVPPEYYLTNLTGTSREEMERVVVGRGSVHKLTFEISEPRSVLQWEFVTNEYDIAFGVYLKNQSQAGKKKKEEIVPITRRQSHVVPESGYHICELQGTYVLKFDNSYSWARTKEVFYCVQVVPPDTEFTVPQPLTFDAKSVSASSTNSDEFFDCAQDFIERVSQASHSSLTAVAEVSVITPAKTEDSNAITTSQSSVAGRVILDSSISTTV